MAPMSEKEIDRRIADAEWKGKIDQKFIDLCRDTKETNKNIKEIFKRMNAIELKAATEGGKWGIITSLVTSIVIGLVLYGLTG